jgi:hypothetical protein
MFEKIYAIQAEVGGGVQRMLRGSDEVCEKLLPEKQKAIVLFVSFPEFVVFGCPLRFGLFDF